MIYVGDGCPDFAESYHELVADCSSKTPDIPLTEDDYGATYFSSGTTGFPRAILHKHQSLTQALKWNKNIIVQAEMTYFCVFRHYIIPEPSSIGWASLVAGSKAVLLKGTKPDTILSAVSSEKCTIVWLLVPWAQDILDALDRGDLNCWKIMSYRSGA